MRARMPAFPGKNAGEDARVPRQSDEITVSYIET